MTANSKDEALNHNLVMFPASKNFKMDPSAMEQGHDPLYDLLNEYSDILDCELPDHLDYRFEDEEQLVSNSYDSLEAFLGRNYCGENQNPDDKLIMAINDKIEAIKDAKERIKFYLNEIEMFLPSRKK